MKRRLNLIPLFVILGVLAFLGILTSQTSFGKNIVGGMEKVLSSMRQQIFSLSRSSNNETTLEVENKLLQKKIVDQKIVQSEMQALKDQFETNQTQELKLLPVKIIGMPHFIPGVNNPEQFIISSGEKEGLKKGQGVIVKNAVVGKIVKVSPHNSVVDLVTNKNFSVPAKTIETNALGIVMGNSNGEASLGSVVMSDTLSQGDIVVTAGDMNEKGIGFVPNLVLGTIASVEKKPSALFQTADIKNPLLFSKLTLVFVIVGMEP